MNMYTFISKKVSNILLIVIFLPFLGKSQLKAIKIVRHVDVAIKSYVISILTDSTFDGFIDCTNIVTAKDLNEDFDINDCPD